MGRRFAWLVGSLTVITSLGLSVAPTLAADPTEPGAVSGLAGSQKSPTAITLSWSAPSDTGGLPIDDYLIQYRIDAGAWTTEADGTSTQTSYRVFGLTRGSTYSFRISAVNALGTGPSSEVGPFKMASVPLAPVDVRVSGSTNAAIYSSVERTVSWILFDDGGSAVSDYVVQYTSDGASWTTVSDGVSTQTSAVVTGLTRGVRYTFRVAAVNSEGQGDFSRSRVVGAGGSHSCQVRLQVTSCWGANGSYQVGSGSAGSIAVATSAGAVGSSVDVALGSAHSCVLLLDKTVQCFGANSEGQLGNGTPTSTTRSTAGAKVKERTSNTTITNVTQIVSGANHVCALDTSSSVFCWGQRLWQQVAGDGSNSVGTNTAVRSSVLRDVRSLTASAGGWHTCALTWTGDVYCWGRNDWYALGDGTTTTRSAPMLVAGLADVTHVSAGTAHTCVRQSSGSIRCWGSNGDAELGTGSTTTETGIVQVVGVSGAVDVYASGNRTCARSLVGLQCWGRNSSGQIGNGTTSTRVLSPATLSVPVNGAAVLGPEHSFHVSFLGGLSSWGVGSNYQLGNGTTSSSSSPISVVSAPDAEISSSSILVTVPDVPTSVIESSHAERSVALTWATPVDNGGSAISDYIVQYSVDGSSWLTFSDGVSSVASATVTGLARGTNYVFRVAATNSVGTSSYSAASGSSTTGVVPRAVRNLRTTRWAFGYRAADLRVVWSAPDNGGRTISDYDVDYRVEGDSSWIRVSDGVSATTNSTISGLGRSARYEIRVRAVNPEGAGSWSYLGTENVATGGSFACMARSDGTIWCWGANGSGQLGDATTTPRATPAQSAFAASPTSSFSTSKVSGIDAGSSHTCMLWGVLDSGGGNVSCLGSNDFGQVGPSETVGTAASSLQSVISNATASQVAAGGGTSCALRTNSTIVCWGRNSHGQLGNGSTSDTASPVLVSGVTTATAITVGGSHSCALLASGGVQCWGANAAGQLGNSSTVDSSVPVTVTGLSGVIAVEAGGNHTCAILSSYAIRCWGANTTGQLGNSSNTNSSTPVAVAGITNAEVIALGSSHSCASLVDSSVRCWGSNVSGQIGDGSNTARSAPVEVAITDAVRVVAGDLFSCAVLADSRMKCWGAGGSGQLGQGGSTSNSSPQDVVGVASSSAVVPVTTPSVVRNLVEVGRSATSVDISWQVPLDDGGSAITGYRIVGGIAAVDVGVSTTSATLTGLTRGLTYNFTVYPLNVANDPASPTVLTTGASVGPIVPAVDPSVVRNLTKVGVSATSVSLWWVAPEDDGGRAVTDYVIHFRQSGTGSWQTFDDGVSTSLSATVTGLSQGQAYDLRVSAVTANGSSAPVDLASPATPATVPNKPTFPTDPTVTSGSEISLTWVAPYSGGEPVSDYIVEYDLGGGWQVATEGVSVATTSTLTGFSRGNVVRLRVAAVNVLGRSEYAYPFEPTMSSMSIGLNSCIVSSTQEVWCWGSNESGQNGNGLTSTRLEMTKVPRLPAVSKVVTGLDFACALATVGSVYCWGANARGQLGDGTTAASKTPVKVSGISAATDISVGRAFVCAVVSPSSTLQCWGDNQYRQAIPTSSNPYLASPTAVSGVSGVVKVALSAEATCYVNASANVYCWGRNNWYQTGSATTPSTVSSPLIVRTSTSTSATTNYLSSVVGLESNALADTFCALRSNQQVACWGANNSGQVGVGTSDTLSYARVNSLAGVVQISVGSGHSCARSSAGAIRCWGYNHAGQVSKTAGSNVFSPTVVESTSVMVWAGAYVTCSQASIGGSISCWGSNGSFGLMQTNSSLIGGPHTASFNRAAQVLWDRPAQPSTISISGRSTSQATVNWATPSDSGGAPIVDYLVEVSANGGAWTEITRTRSLSTSYQQAGLVRSSQYRWRVTAHSESGLSSDPAVLAQSVYAAVAPGSPTKLTVAAYSTSSVSLSWSAPVDDGGRAVQDYAVSYKPAGGSWTVFADGVSNSTFATVSGLARGTSYDFKVLAENAEGQSAQSSTDNDNWGLSGEVSLGRFSCAIDAIGDVYCSGAAPFGTTWTEGGWTKIDGIESAVSVEVGEDQACAINGSGDAWCWGANDWGQLGDGTRSSSAKAVKVQIDSVAQISAGQAYTCARKTDGTVWCWGAGDSGRNGIGTTTYVPQRLTSLPVSSIDIVTGDWFACSLGTDNLVRCWGHPSDGRLGNPNNQNITTTPQIVRTSTSTLTSAYLSGVVEIDNHAEGAFTCARKSDGTVWCWGSSAVMQAGQTSGASTFARPISGLSSVTQIALGSHHGCAIAALGKVLCWGWNAAGMLGNGTRGSSSTAVQAIASGATAVAGGYLNSFARINGVAQFWGDNDRGQQARTVSSDVNDDLLSPVVGNFSSSVSKIPATVPGVVTGLSEVSYTASSVSLSWVVPADDGGRALSDYVVEYQLSGGSWAVFADGASTATSVTVTGLTKGSGYRFRVSAVNAEGTGASVATTSDSVPRGVPGAPTGLTVSSYTTTSVSLSWTAPSDNGGAALSDYVVEYQPSGGSWAVFADGVSTATSVTVTGLTRGTSYSFRVSAQNSEGRGSSANAFKIPATIPSAPVLDSVVARVQGLSFTITYSVPDNGGRDVSAVHYRIDGGTWTNALCCSPSFVISGLSNGQTYAIDLRVSTAEGTSAASNVMLQSPATVPSAPTSLAISRPAAGSSLSVAFGAANANGRPITSYQYSLNSGSTWVDRTDGGADSSPLVISGLTNGQTYTVRLRAVNAQGQGTMSSAVSLAPAGPPSAPSISRVESASGRLSVVFDPPTSTGGLAVSNYEFSIDDGTTWTTRTPTSIASPLSIEGLVNGQAYGIRLRAVNPQGAGAQSELVSSTPAALPTAPTSVSVSRPITGGRLLVDYLPPVSDGGSGVVAYQYSLNGGTTWINRGDGRTTAAPLEITGLVNGQTYQVAIRAINGQGAGLTSTITEIAPAGVPSAPTNILGSTPVGGAAVVVAFVAGAANGEPITGYQVSTDDGATWTNRSDGEVLTSPITVSGLTNGTAYKVKVRAVNAQGSGAPSSAVTLVPATIPGKGGIASYEYGESQFTVVVTPPDSDGGASITGYNISTDNGATWEASKGSAISITVDGVENGETYPVVVRALNRQGIGPSSDVTYVTIGDLPTVATTGAADVTSSSARLEGTVDPRFVRAIVEFQLSTKSDFSVNVSTVSAGFLSGGLEKAISATVVDLSESTTYFYRIVAKNSLGLSRGETLTFTTRKPIGVSVNDGDVYTRSPAVKIAMSWPRGATAALVSNDGGFMTSTRFNLADSIDWTLQSSGDERLPKTVYTKFILQDGSRSSTYTDDIILDETAPTLTSVVANRAASGGVSVLALETYKLTVSAADGNSGIARFELRRAADLPVANHETSTPTAAVHDVLVSVDAGSLEVRAIDRAGNASQWRSFSLSMTATASATSVLPATSSQKALVRTPGSVVSAKTLTSFANLKRFPGSTTKLRAMSSAKVCKVEGGVLKPLGKGTCKVEVIVTQKSGKSQKKVVSIVVR